MNETKCTHCGVSMHPDEVVMVNDKPYCCQACARADGQVN